MTQRDMVLRLLQNAGRRGIHTFELRAQYIGNPSQRIAELEALGHRITHRRERLHGRAIGTRYVLMPAIATVCDQAVDEPVALFAPPAVPPRPHYQEDAA